CDEAWSCMASLSTLSSVSRFRPLLALHRSLETVFLVSAAHQASHLRLIPPRGIVHVMTNIIDLDITGMTCSSCAARIEKKLNRVEGCEATVNFATERARVEVSEGVSADDLIDVVKKTGYGASRVAPEPTAEPGGHS